MLQILCLLLTTRGCWVYLQQQKSDVIWKFQCNLNDNPAKSETH